jgi:plasmid stabilization system protein ParE
VPNVVWLPEALEDPRRLHEFLATNNPEAAGKAIGRIALVARQLEEFPEIGQPMDDGVRRQVFIQFGAGACVVRYRSDSERNLVVMRVWHSREEREG